MQILFTTLREASHFLPMVPFLEACQRRGHEVAVAAPPDFADRVAAMGVKFFPFGHPGDDGLRPIWARMRGASEEEMNRIAVGEIFAGVCARAALPGLLETMERWRPSIVVRESQEYAAFVAAERLGIPHLRVAISARGAELGILDYAAPEVDAHRRGVGLAADPAGDRIRDEVAVTLFPSSFEAPEAAPAPILRFRATRKQAPRLPAWWGTRQEPFVYVTLGTVTGGIDSVRAAYRVVLGALIDLPIRALLTIGAKLPVDALGEIPPNVHIERFVPQDEVIPHAAAVLCHGGSGTVLGTLAAGVPMVVAPLFADQPFNAGRVAAIGAGLALPTRTASAEAIGQALSLVLAEASFRTAARAMAAEIAALPSIDDAGLEIEKLARR